MMTSSASQRILAKYGKSFYWASFFLENDQAEKAARLYKFCRYVDDLADGDSPHKLDYLQEIYNSLGTDNPYSILEDSYALEDKPQLTDFLLLAYETGVPITAARELLAGMISDQTSVQIENESELLRYCHAVAGTVGVMMSKIIGCREPAAQQFAVDLGIAMQLTNIARDVLEDAQMGRRYLPATWLNLTPNSIAKADKSVHSDVSLAIEKVLDLAEKYYQSALFGIHMIPGRARFTIAVALRLYRQIGVQLRRKGTCWWNGRTVVGKTTKVYLTARALFDLMPKDIPRHQQALHQALKGLTGVRIS
jgi:phytoene synthase